MKRTDEEHECCYHLTSCPVRRARSGSHNRASRRNDLQRRRLIDRIKALARCFAVEIFGYAIMADHFHIVLRYDPNAREFWTDEEVARRWTDAFTPRENGRVDEQRKALKFALLMEDASGLERARRTLGSLSDFMQHLEHPITERAQLGDGGDAHSLERRLYSEALVSEQALLAAMLHVDLHTLRAGEVKRLSQCRHSSIGERLQERDEEALAARLAPLASGLEDR